MAQKSNSFERFWKKLKRRKVVHVITVNAPSAFVILQLVDMVGEPLTEQKWYKNPDYKGTIRYRVGMKIIKNIVDNPLPKEIIRDTEGLKYLSILLMPKATNFKVSLDEWSIINKLTN
jgi:hypothetical protein